MIILVILIAFYAYFSKKNLNTKKNAGVSSDKTDFDGGWDLSLSNPNHVP